MASWSLRSINSCSLGGQVRVMSQVSSRSPCALMANRPVMTPATASAPPKQPLTKPKRGYQVEATKSRGSSLCSISSGCESFCFHSFPPVREADSNAVLFSTSEARRGGRRRAFIVSSGRPAS